ncbi:MAG: orotate phosphoribosyltransferase [Caenispirillum bisanense]|nr:orotate phosphoribosyltransferase [Caenispirillum bisanense]MCA1972617.1 orotate phosphoribosyltransferase [Caenispirillum sp.]
MSLASPPAAAASRSPEQKAAGLAVARILLEIQAVNFRPEEPYILTSGRASPVYIDCRKVIAFPRARRKIVELARDCIEREIGCESITHVAGGETAGIPYAAWISDALMLPMLYVRKKPKGFGRMAQIEGHLTEGGKVLLVEDLATDGGSKLVFADAIRAAGAECAHTFVPFFYGIIPGAEEALLEKGVKLHYLACWWDVLEVAEQQKLFTLDALGEVRAFFADPIGWSKAHGGKEE